VNVRDPFRFRDLVRKVEKPSSRPSVRMLQVIALESQRSRIPQMAAALSYRTVFGLLPIIIVGLVAMRFFISDNQIDEFINRGLHYAGLEAIVLESPPEGESQDHKRHSDAAISPSESPKPTSESAAEPLQPEKPAADPQGKPVEPLVVTPEEVRRSELAGTIRGLIDHLKHIHYRAIGGIGAITLIYAAISMLIEIERCFNQIFRVPVGKPWRRRILEYWALLTLGTPCLVGTFYVGEVAKSLVDRAVESTGFSSSSAVGIVISGYAITVIISAVLLFLVYTILPNTRVKVVPAIAGALLAAILWEAGKWGFTQYIRYSTSYAKFYGSIALIPLFLLWIYATWAIVLFGLHVTYHIQLARTKNGALQPIAWSEPPAGVVDPTAAVAIVHAAARGFLAGKPVSLASLVDSTRAQGSVVSDLVSRLVDANFLYRVNVADDPNNVTLTQPPERIPVRSVLELGYEVAGPAEEEGVTPGVRARLRDAHLDAAGASTVADLLTSASTVPLTHNHAPIPLANKPQPETSPPLPANPYPQDPSADTLPLQIEGGPDRDQKSAQNGLGDRDPSHRPQHDPGVL
jgi:membrane protein